MSGLRLTALTADVDGLTAFCAAAGAANVRNATAMAETTAVLSVRKFFSRVTSGPGVCSFDIGSLRVRDLRDRRSRRPYLELSLGKLASSVVAANAAGAGGTALRGGERSCGEIILPAGRIVNEDRGARAEVPAPHKLNAFLQRYIPVLLRRVFVALGFQHG